MSGIFIERDWYENTNRICRRCKSPVWESNSLEYPFQCLECDEDLFEFETDEQCPHYSPKVIIARHVGGITLNVGLEYVLDDEKNELVFNGQSEAETFLLSKGVPLEDLEFMYFIEFENEIMDRK